MTVKTHRRPRRPRYSIMESLGFTETPTTSYSAPPVVVRSAPSHLVSTIGTGARTVEEIWNTTEFEPNSMLDWKPVDVGRQLDQKIRLPLIAIWIVIIGVIGTGGVWLWQNSNRSAGTAIGEVQDAGQALASTLDPLAAAAASIDPATAPIPDTILPAVTQTDTASRALFSAAADLSGTQATSRSVATDAATRALNATKNLTNMAAYVGAATPILTAPTLITEPELIDLQTAVSDFGGWRATFGMVLANLPDGVLPEVTAELNAIRGDLEAIQGAYVDGLREDDRIAALDAVRDLEGRLASAWSLLLSGTESAKTTIVEQIETARESLRSLTG